MKIFYVVFTDFRNTLPWGLEMMKETLRIWILLSVIEKENFLFPITLSDTNSAFIGSEIMLKHFLIENIRSQPHVHREPIQLTSSDVDSMRDFIWCQFQRPLRPTSMWDLDLSQPLFHFFFHGEMNQSM